MKRFLFWMVLGIVAVCWVKAYADRFHQRQGMLSACIAACQEMARLEQGDL